MKASVAFVVSGIARDEHVLREEDPMNNNKTILIDGVRYHKDRPASCRQCYFWKNRKAGCTLGKENCYYLAESPKAANPCEGCCYGPCVSFCMKKVLGQKGVPVNA